uniref:Uncharacterized protein n=1 Tax=Oryza glumipatula TaxID=40148 RepID=A0A0E0BJ03_9ORYZ
MAALSIFATRLRLEFVAQVLGFGRPGRRPSFCTSNKPLTGKVYRNSPNAQRPAGPSSGGIRYMAKSMSSRLGFRPYDPPTNFMLDGARVFFKPRLSHIWLPSQSSPLASGSSLLPSHATNTPNIVRVFRETTSDCLVPYDNPSWPSKQGQI